MNKTELRAITLIVKKLGWNDMPVTVAISAIQKMINNDIAISLDCCGFKDEPEDALLSISTRKADNIWLRLFISDYQTHHDESLRHWALTYRPQIETWMKLGILFEDACNMWNIPSKEWEWKYYQDYLAEMQEAYDERQIFCENKEAVDFCLGNCMTLKDLKAMQEYYNTMALQHGIEDAEYEKECEEYEQALYEEYSWYIHARQMGWE